MKIAISVESTSDLSKELLSKYDIKIIPYKIVLGSEIYTDGDIEVEKMFEFVDKNGSLPKTTALNEFEYTEYFEGLRKEYDAVVHVCLSSGLSSSCGNAMRAGSNIDGVYVIDSKSLSTGIGLLAIYARELANAGEAPEVIKEKLEKRVDKLQVSFVVERLDYLYKGGRCNSLQLLGANLLKIRPRIVVDVNEGKMLSDKKYRGSMPSVVAKYCAETLSEFGTPDKTRAFVTYTTATPEMVENAKNALIDAGFNEILETRAGGTIASHCGGNTLGILYFNDGE
jgi:DegV family protein with EDD domain